MVLSFVIPVVGECVGVTVIGMLVAVLVDAADDIVVSGVLVGGLVGFIAVGT